MCRKQSVHIGPGCKLMLPFWGSQNGIGEGVKESLVLPPSWSQPSLKDPVEWFTSLFFDLEEIVFASAAHILKLNRRKPSILLCVSKNWRDACDQSTVTFSCSSLLPSPSSAPASAISSTVLHRWDTALAFADEVVRQDNKSQTAGFKVQLCH